MVEIVHMMHYFVWVGAGMPTIAKLGSVLIRMFADDHNPPHFHVVTPDGEALVLVSDFSVVAGVIDRRSLDVALKWATENKKILDDEWRHLNER
jgi:hypothetical protein